MKKNCAILKRMKSPYIKDKRMNAPVACKGNLFIVRKRGYLLFGVLLLGLLLSGCPKKILKPVIVEKPLAENPIAKLLETFSFAETLQARASIRIDMVRNGQKMNFLLNGMVLYQKPDRFRLLGYHPFGMGLFDALYRNGEFFLLIPLQKRAYTGEVSQFGDLVEKVGPIDVFSEKQGGNEIPDRIRIEIPEKEIRVDIKLKETSLNPSLPEDAFEWSMPEGVEIRPLDRLLRKKLR
jgi:outer membrane lipoprotein-sorting protein